MNNLAKMVALASGIVTAILIGVSFVYPNISDNILYGVWISAGLFGIGVVVLTEQSRKSAKAYENLQRDIAGLLAVLIGALTVVAISAVEKGSSELGYNAVLQALVAFLLGNILAFIVLRKWEKCFRTINLFLSSLLEGALLNIIVIGAITTSLAIKFLTDWASNHHPSKAPTYHAVSEGLAIGVIIVTAILTLWWMWREYNKFFHRKKREEKSSPAMQDVLLFPSVDDAVKMLQEQGATIIHETKEGEIYLVDEKLLDEHGWALVWVVKPYFTIAKVMHVLMPPEAIEVLQGLISAR